MTVEDTAVFPTVHRAWGLFPSKWDWKRRDYFTQLLMLLTSATCYFLDHSTQT